MLERPPGWPVIFGCIKWEFLWYSKEENESSYYGC